MRSALNLSRSCTDLVPQKKPVGRSGHGIASSVFGHILKGLATVTAGLALSVLAACGGGGGGNTPPPPAAPTITSFVASPATITAGQSATLTPVFTNATSASIDNGVGTVLSGTGYSVKPSTTTAYTLTANGTGGPVTATATVMVTPIVQLTQQGPKLVGSGDAGGSAWQGSSVSLSADGNTAIVGGPEDNNPGTGVNSEATNNGGAVWVWTKSGGVWAQQGPKLVASDAVYYSRQGFSVSISADGNSAVVGSPDDNSNAGAVWIWTRSGGVWTQQGSKLVGSGAVGTYALQGYSVSISADGNTAVVGSPGDNSFAGAAWIWIRSGGVWTQQGTKLVGSGAVGTDARQGSSVSISSDGNTALVGGNNDNTRTGAVWVWTRSNGAWMQQTKLVAPGSVTNDWQGQSLSVSADGNTALVGCPGANNSAGAAWVWTRSGEVWTPQGTKLVGSGTNGAAGQGYSVSLSADGNTALVGGPWDNRNAGATWVWKRSGGNWTQQGTKLVGPDAVGAAVQGFSVSVSADGSTAIVGGPEDNNGVVGAIWVWTWSGSAWTQQGTKLVGSGAVSNAIQGVSVSLSSDGNTAIVGGPYDNHRNGAAWIWIRSGGVWAQLGARLVGSGAVLNASQGSSVSLSADGYTAIVGGPGDQNNSGGAVWIWTRSGGVWTQQGPKLVGSGAIGFSGQGLSVSLSADGNTAIVGGAWDNSNAGAVWIWTRSGGVWTQQGPKLVGSGAIGFSGQGQSVSLSADGNTAIVGGVFDNNNVGAVWIWTRSGGVWTQQGGKLVGSGVTQTDQQGSSVSLSADGNTAIVGAIGGVWTWTRSGGVWTQQGNKLFATDAAVPGGFSVSLSADGNTAIAGGAWDNNSVGATWVWKRSGGNWIQQGAKLVGTGAVGHAWQGRSVCLSGDGNTALVGGNNDNGGAGATWVFTQ